MVNSNSTGSELLDKFCSECCLEKCPPECATLQMRVQNIADHD
jgi:hypothetical protein